MMLHIKESLRNIKIEIPVLRKDLVREIKLASKELFHLLENNLGSDIRALKTTTEKEVTKLTVAVNKLNDRYVSDFEGLRNSTQNSITDLRLQNAGMERTGKIILSVISTIAVFMGWFFFKQWQPLKTAVDIIPKTGCEYGRSKLNKKPDTE